MKSWKLRYLATVLVAFCCVSVSAQQLPGRVYDALGTTTPLTNGATFTSPWVDVQAYNSVVVAVTSSNSASFSVQFSPDGTNADSIVPRTYNPSKITPPERFTIGRRFVRVVLTNDSGTDMSTLRVQVLAGDKTVLNFPADGTLPQRAGSTPVRVDDYKIDIGASRREGATNWRKFGYNTDVDTAAAETVWSFGGRWSRLSTARTLQFVSTSAQDGAAGTGFRQILVTGVGPSYTYQTETVTLNGTSVVTTTSTWLGVNRITATSVGSAKVNAGNITATATVDATVQAYIPAGVGTSQQAIFTTPAGRLFLSDGVLINVRKLSGGGGAPRVTIFGYYHSTSANAVLQVFRLDIDTDVENTVVLVPPNPFTVGPRDSLEFVAETDTNNTVVNVNFWGTELQDP